MNKVRITHYSPRRIAVATVVRQMLDVGSLKLYSGHFESCGRSTLSGSVGFPFPAIRLDCYDRPREYTFVIEKRLCVWTDSQPSMRLRRPGTPTVSSVSFVVEGPFVFPRK